MNPSSDPTQHPGELQGEYDDGATVYSVEVFSRITGAGIETISQYQELGILSKDELTPESVRLFHRVAHVRALTDCDDRCLSLFGQMIREIESLRSRLRS